MTPGSSPFRRSAAKRREILRENVSFQFLSLRHHAEILYNTLLFAPLPADTRVARRASPRSGSGGAAAALDFVKDGQHPSEDLQVSTDRYEDFSSYDAFYKGEPSPEFLAKRFGPAGDGQQYHHIVTQGGTNAHNISPEQLQNTDNIIRLPTILHEAVNGAYLKDSLIQT